jgi:putative membrane protein
MEPLVTYLHYLSMISIGAFLTVELILCRPGLSAAHVRLLPRLDVGYFAAALLALATGLLRVFVYAKGWPFYASNPIFWVKMALYLAVALTSIAPTIAFIRWSRMLGAGSAPLPASDDVARVRRLVHIELGLLALIPLMAVLMARGIGR